VIAAPLIREMAIRHANALMGGTALVTTFVGLLITDLVSDGLNIDGVGPGSLPRSSSGSRRCSRRCSYR
jgi:hypothetical protein